MIITILWQPAPVLPTHCAAWLFLPSTGEGLMNQIISHLIEFQYSRGNTSLFLYTKCNTARFFGDLGFYEIARVEGKVVFMENRRTGFSDYLKRLQRETSAFLESEKDRTRKSVPSS